MKSCYPTEYEWDDDGEELEALVYKGLRAIKYNKDSINTFKDVNPDYIHIFIEKVALKSKETDGYNLIIFRDSETNEAVGACLFSSGRPWYDPTKRVLNEECTVAFKRGYGLTRAIAEYMIDQLNNHNYDLIQASSANDCVANLIENTYNKYGYKQYKSFYKTK